MLDPTAIALHTVVRGGHRPGDTVVVIGCGGVGIAAIQGARVAGAALIVAVDTVAAKHDVARRFGATHAVTPDALSDLSVELTGGDRGAGWLRFAPRRSPGNR